MCVTEEEEEKGEEKEERARERACAREKEIGHNLPCIMLRGEFYTSHLVSAADGGGEGGFNRRRRRIYYSKEVVELVTYT